MLRRLETCPDGRTCPDCTSCRQSALCRIMALPGATVTLRSFARGESLGSRAGPGGLRLQAVQSGMVAASATMPDGRRQIMCFLVPGDVICPFEVADAECCAEAVTDSEVWEAVVPMGDPATNGATQISDLLFDLSHSLLGRSLAHVVQLGRYDGAERLCAFLLDMTVRTGQHRNGVWRLTLPMSREHIADYLGLNSETVSRIFTRIRKDGIARFRSPTQCEIRDMDRLKARVPLVALGRAGAPDISLREMHR